MKWLILLPIILLSCQNPTESEPPKDETCNWLIQVIVYENEDFKTYTSTTADVRYLIKGNKTLAEIKQQYKTNYLQTRKIVYNFSKLPD